MNQLPIYKRLIKKYTQEILTHVLAPGKQIDSINKIMLKHNVSRETAKIVLGNLAKEGLIVKIPGKGSFVREPDKEIDIWGIILPMYSSNMEELIDKITMLATDQGKGLEYYFHYNNPEEEIKLVSSLVNKGYKALFVVPNNNEAITAKFYSRLEVKNSRLFLIDHTMAGSSYNYVIQSYDLGIKRAATYLAERNSGNFLFVNDSAWRGVNIVAELILTTLTHYGETMYDRNVYSVVHHNEVTSEYIKKNTIGGIITFNDTDAIKIYDKLLRQGFRFPDEISLVNYGNTELIQMFNKGITAIDCLYDEMIEKIRIQINKSEKFNEQHVVLPKLVIRET